MKPGRGKPLSLDLGGLFLGGVVILGLLAWAGSRVLYHVSGNAAADACRDDLGRDYQDENNVISWLGPSAVKGHNTYDGCDSGERAETTVTLAPEWSSPRVEAVLRQHDVVREARLDEGISRWRAGRLWIFVYPAATSKPTTVRVTPRP